ncbi:hypothetical protein [Halalkalibacter alkaliphilus]|uniref:Uncharacterized protein n=1 Tax=Halalkalibacter alkaliphilus TaxID=2917993 RepID=A0A9X2CWA6_9BACI|nr:hypothetical protein [Halalkalibacter alkaliphilus]MCL7749418.1 hypothetical protein [Halalkalibacter alkaliphilus]
MYGRYGRPPGPPVGQPYQPYQPYQQNDKTPKSKKPKVSSYNVQDLFTGKNLDIIAAALLLSGKLKVDAVELYRSSPVVTVTLLGEFLTPGNDKSNALADFLKENGDMTLDDVFEAFQQRIEED